jgi:nucleoid DNA-binding protein
VPATGAEVKVPATTVAKFKPGKSLKEAVKNNK